MVIHFIGSRRPNLRGEGFACPRPLVTKLKDPAAADVFEKSFRPSGVTSIHQRRTFSKTDEVNGFIHRRGKAATTCLGGLTGWFRSFPAFTTDPGGVGPELFWKSS